MFKIPVKIIPASEGIALETKLLKDKFLKITH